MRWDVFISYASEDRETVAGPLAKMLTQQHLKVWVDYSQLRLGDSLVQAISEGLASCSFGVVILSPAFFSKSWPQRELDGLMARELPDGKLVLPVWHDLDYADIARWSPILAGRVGVSTKQGLAKVATEILACLDTPLKIAVRCRVRYRSRALTEERVVDLPLNQIFIQLFTSGRWSYAPSTITIKQISNPHDPTLLSPLVDRWIDPDYGETDPVIYLEGILDTKGTGKRITEALISKHWIEAVDTRQEQYALTSRGSLFLERWKAQREMEEYQEWRDRLSAEEADY